jgi:pimeloyl-ACP methyl ester carboxylesterase
MAPAVEIAEERAVYRGLATTVLRVDGECPPFLLLPGYSDIADTWRAVLAELGRAGRAAAAVDLPGSSIRTDRVDGPLLPKLDGFVADLVRHHAGNGPVVLAGNSLGGVMSIRAAQDPDLPLAGVMPIGPAGLGHSRWINYLAGDPIIRRLARLPISIPSRLVHGGIRLAMPRLAVGRSIFLEPAAVKAYASQYRSAGDIRRLIGGAHSLLDEIENCYDLELIERPVLLVWGARDRLVPPGGAERLLDAVPGSRLVTLERSGHCPQLEEPRRIAQLLLEFDAEVRGRSASKTEAA